MLHSGIISSDIYTELLQAVFLDISEFLEALKIVIPLPQYTAILLYLSRKQPITPRGCGKVIYKPNNQQFAHQGAVSSSDRILKLTVDTVTKCAYNMNNQFYKEKTSKCEPNNYYVNQNKRMCR